MACPVNHPMFHAVVFLIGVLVVLSRYVRAAPSPSDHLQSQLMAIVATGLREGWETRTSLRALLDP